MPKEIDVNNNVASKGIFVGLLFMLISTFVFAAMVVTIRHVADDLPTAEIVFLRNLISLLILIPAIFYHGGKSLKTSNFSMHFWRSFIGLVGMELWFYSLVLMPINVATALSFTAPLFTTIIAVIFLREKIGLKRIIALLVGFAGVLVIIRPSPAHGLDSSIVIILTATIFWAVASNIVKSLTKRESTWQIMFYMTLIMTILSAPLGVWQWQHPTNEHWLLLLFISGLSLIAHFLFVAAIARVDLVKLMPIDFMRLVFTAILAYFIFEEVIDIYTAIGGFIIVFSAVYISWRERKVVVSP